MSSRPAAPPPAPRHTAPVAAPEGFVPPPISKVEDTGLTLFDLASLALKTLYNAGNLTGFRISELMTLPFTGIVDQVLEYLKREKLVEVKSAGGFGEGAYLYAITGVGIERAREAMERNLYAGPAPVPVARYVEAIRKQAAKRKTITQRAMRAVLSHLVMNEKTFGRIGPARRRAGAT